MRRLALIPGLLAAVAAVIFATASAADDARVYKVELDNAFGLVEGSDVKVAGVRAGTIEDLDINERKRAVATVSLRAGLDSFRTDVRCETRPQSLIAEYFIDCDPGKGERELAPGSLIPVEQTSSTVQPDLVNNILREPYRDRLRLIINEFGTGLAGRPEDLNRAVRSGAPALRETDKVLRVLASQSKTIRDLNADSDEIFGALAKNRKDVARFITEARQTAVASAERREDISASFGKLPTLLGELRPAMARLGELAGEQTPLMTDLREAAPELERFTRTFGPFADASLPSLDTLGDAAKIGARAMRKGKDELAQLERVGKNVSPVSTNLGKLFATFDDRDRATEPDPRSPGGRGFTVLEGLLNYAYYQTGVLTTFDQNGHTLRLMLLPGSPCSQFSTTTYAKRADGSVHPCSNWVGPNQPGLTDQVCVTKDSRGHTIRNFCPAEPYGAEVGVAGAPVSVAGPVRETAPAGSGPAPALPLPGSPSPGAAPQAPKKIVPDLPKPLDDVLKQVKPQTDKLPLPGARSPVRLRARGTTNGARTPASNRYGLRARNRRAVNDLLDYLLGA